MHLVCGIDESAPGRNAARVAGDLASRLGATLTLVRTVPGGDAARRLLSVAEKEQADLLCIPHPRRRALRGDVHTRVLRRAPIPVVLVPAGAEVGASDQIVLGCRRSTVPRRAAEVAGGLAARLRASLVVTQVLPDGWPPEEKPTSWSVYDAARTDVQAANEAAGRPLDVEYLEREGDAPEHLARTADELDAMLIVVGKRRRGALRSRLRPPVADRVARRAWQPVVAVPDSTPSWTADADLQEHEHRAVSPLA